MATTEYAVQGCLFEDLEHETWDIALRTFVLVHPGSLCGSADAMLEDAEAERTRRGILAFLRALASDPGIQILVIEGMFSDELPTWMPEVAALLEDARAEGRSVLAHDDDAEDHLRPWQYRAADFVESLADRGQEVFVGGAWLHTGDLPGGCVTAVAETLQSHGVPVTVLRNAAAQLPW
jgi:hypothetical protein